MAPQELLVLVPVVYLDQNEQSRTYTSTHRIFEDPSRMTYIAHSHNITSDHLRDVIVVGQSLGSDDKYLRTMGYSWKFTPNMIDETDTQGIPSAISGFFVLPVR